MSACLPKKAQVLEVKHGDTMVLGCTALDLAGDPVSLDAITVTAQMRSLDDNSLAADLEFEAVGVVAGTYELWYPGDGRVVAPAGDYAVDIQYSTPSGSRVITRSSRSFYIRVLEDVTEGAEA